MIKQSEQKSQGSLPGAGHLDNVQMKYGGCWNPFNEELEKKLIV